MKFSKRVLWRLKNKNKRLKPEKYKRSEEHTLNSSHITISYAVFCLKKKKKKKKQKKKKKK